MNVKLESFLLEKVTFPRAKGAVFSALGGLPFRPQSSAAWLQSHRVSVGISEQRVTALNMFAREFGSPGRLKTFPQEVSCLLVKLRRARSLLSFGSHHLDLLISFYKAAGVVCEHFSSPSGPWLLHSSLLSRRLPVDRWVSFPNASKVKCVIRHSYKPCGDTTVVLLILCKGGSENLQPLLLKITKCCATYRTGAYRNSWESSASGKSHN